MAKRIISFALIACILLSVALPLSIYAAPSVDGTDGNTSRFYNKQSNTGLDAYPGSAKVDGLWDENDEWDNALPLTVNYATKSLITDHAIADTYDGDFYLLWDEDGLYLMEVQRNWSNTVVTHANALTSNPRPWRTSTSGELRAWGTQIIAVSNQKFEQNASFSKMLFVFQTSTDAEGETLQIGDSATPVFVDRTMKYTSWPGAVSGSYGAATESVEGIECVYTKTADKQYVMELKMSWDYLGMSNKPSEATEADIVDAVGLRLGMGFAGGTHLSKLDSGSDGTGFDPITLKANATTVKKATFPTPIDTIDAEGYWTNETDGQFVVNADAEVYEISTAKQLLGLSLAMENNANDKAWTQGKIFCLTEDIDLNPNVDWKLYRKQQLYPGSNVSEEYIATQTPVNEWLSLDCFYGVFDGQGHTISGVWALGAPQGETGNDAETMWGVFGGKATGGSAVKNVVLDNGYVSSGTAGNYGGIFGQAVNVGTVNIADTRDDGVVIENVYIGTNFVVDVTAVTATPCGGVLGSTGYATGFGNSADKALDVTMKNVVFAGAFVGSPTVGYDGCFMGQLYANWMFDTKNVHNYILMEDCVVTGTYTDTKIDGSDKTSTFVANKGNNTDFFTATNCYDFGNGAEQSIPVGLEGKYIETAQGVMPVAVADMLTQYAYQATVTENGTYSIRVIGEVASMAYESVDFKIKITRTSDGKSALWGYGTDEYANAKTVYTSVEANGKRANAGNLNKGILDGENNKLYVMTLNGLDANDTYTMSTTTVWTLLDGTVIKGGSVKTVTPEHWVHVDGIDLVDGYTVVVDQTATKAVKALSERLTASIKQNTGVTLNRVTDNTQKNPEQTKEILLGISNRSETEQAFAGLTTTGYSISFDSEKLVVVATNDFMLEKAVADLEARLIFPNRRAIVDDTLQVTYDGSNDMFSLVDNGSFKYTIVYPSANNEYEQEIAVQLASALQPLFSTKTISTSSDSSSWYNPQKEKALLIGNTGYDLSKTLYQNLGMDEIKWIANENYLAVGTDISAYLDEAVTEFYYQMAEVVKGSYDGKYLLPKDYTVQVTAHEWMENIPEFFGGSYVGCENVGDGSLVFVWKDTVKTDYDAYVTALRNNGFARKQTYSLGNNSYMLLENNATYAYAYHQTDTNTTRLVMESKGAVTEYPDAEPAAYETYNGYVPTMWQIEIDWKTALSWDTSLPEEWRGSNAGMCYMLRVADGSFVIIDSGMNSEKQADIIYEHLKEHSPYEKPIISAWYFSHAHADHTGGFLQFTAKYKDQVTVKAFYQNFSSYNMVSYMKQYSGAKLYTKLHSGMTFYVADARFDVMYTHEDLYPAMTSVPSEEENELSTVIRVTFGGQRIMFLGDVQDTGGAIMLENLPKSELKCDIVQYSHHGWDGPTKDLYDAIEAPTVMWPNAIYSWQKDAEAENIFHRLITEVDWAYYYEVNHYIAYEAEYVKTIIINAEGTGTQEFILPYTPRAERLPDYFAIYDAIKEKEENPDIGDDPTSDGMTETEDDRNDFGPTIEF